MLQPFLPAVGVTDPLAVDVVSSLSQSTQGATGERRQAQEPLHSQPPAEVLNPAPLGSFHENTWTGCVGVVSRGLGIKRRAKMLPLLVSSQEMVDEESRLVRLEQRVTVLWEQMEAAGRWAEQRHGEVMKLYTELLQGGGGGGEAWLSGLMEQQLKRRQVRPSPPVEALGRSHLSS